MKRVFVERRLGTSLLKNNADNRTCFLPHPCKRRNFDLYRHTLHFY